MTYNKDMKLIKLLFFAIVLGIVFSLLAIIFADNATNKATSTHTYENIENIPKCKSALLLGTSKLLRSGSVNPYFSYRIDAAVKLYNTDKISHIVISGDHSRKEYNEPQDMKEALVARGVSADKITLDYAGFNTYDSVYRMHKIFSQEEFIIISQKFHNQRAIYISQHIGVVAHGYNAQGVDNYFGLKVQMREKLARVKMFLDIIINRNPHFLGEKINI